LTHCLWASTNIVQLIFCWENKIKSNFILSFLSFCWKIKLLKVSLFNYLFIYFWVKTKSLFKPLPKPWTYYPAPKINWVLSFLLEKLVSGNLSGHFWRGPEKSLTPKTCFKKKIGSFAPQMHLWWFQVFTSEKWYRRFCFAFHGQTKHATTICHKRQKIGRAILFYFEL
jgi:hypothetical protein